MSLGLIFCKDIYILCLTCTQAFKYFLWTCLRPGKIEKLDHMLNAWWDTKSQRVIFFCYKQLTFFLHTLSVLADGPGSPAPILREECLCVSLFQRIKLHPPDMHSAKLQTAQWLITSSPEEPEVQSYVQILMSCEWAHIACVFLSICVNYYVNVSVWETPTKLRSQWQLLNRLRL